MIWLVSIVILLAGVVTTLRLLVVFDVVEAGFSGKNLWEWSNVWVVPILVLILGSIFLFVSQRNRQRAEESQRQVTNDRAGETATQAYMDSMFSLIRTERLRNVGDNHPARVFANARTHAVLRGLDGARKGDLLRFMNQLNLIRNSQAIISLERADLSEADLSGDDLPEIDLSGANLIRANLFEANLSGSNLRGADLTRASMRDADLSDANLEYTRLTRADMNSIDLSNAHMRFAVLSESNLVEADLSGADLARATLYKTNLVGADLTGVDLTEANLYKTNLIGADLLEANLKDALVSDRQLKQAGTLVGATMPDGMEMTEETWVIFRSPPLLRLSYQMRRSLTKIRRPHR